MRKRSSVASIDSSIVGSGSPGSGGERGDVVAVVAVLGRRLAAPQRVDRRAEPLDLGAGVVVVVLALDGVAREREQARDRSRRTRRFAPTQTVIGPVGFADTSSTCTRSGCSAEPPP